jgi:hypothetical protein
LIYLERKMPKINEQLNALFFTRVGLEHLSAEQKLSFGIGGLMIFGGLSLMALIYFCCGPKGKHGKDCKDCAEDIKKSKKE